MLSQKCDSLRPILIALASIVFLALAMATAHATYVNILEPYNATVQQNGSIYLGNVGPGQTFYVTIASATTNSSGMRFPIGWDEVVASGLPQDWLAENSPLNIAELSIKIAVAPNASNSTYGFNITAINTGNYSKLGSLRLRAYVNVTPNVFKLSVSPTNISAAPGVPADIHVSINNTGVSDSPFVITVHGLPAWNSTTQVIALHHTEGHFTYQVYENEPNQYHVQLYVSSVSSQLIFKQQNITLTTSASVPNDYAALGEGALAFPIIYEPAYAVMYLISLLYKYL